MGNKRIAQSCLTAFSQDLCAKHTASLPKSGLDFNQWQFGESLRNLRIDIWITKQLGENRGRHENLPALERPRKQLDILTSLTFKEGNPGTRIDRNHRSTFRSADVRVNRTLPRNPESFA